MKCTEDPREDLINTTRTSFLNVSLPHNSPSFLSLSPPPSHRSSFPDSSLRFYLLLPPPIFAPYIPTSTDFFPFLFFSPLPSPPSSFPSFFSGLPSSPFSNSHFQLTSSSLFYDLLHICCIYITPFSNKWPSILGESCYNLGIPLAYSTHSHP